MRICVHRAKRKMKNSSANKTFLLVDGSERVSSLAQQTRPRQGREKGIKKSKSNFAGLAEKQRSRAEEKKLLKANKRQKEKA